MMSRPESVAADSDIENPEMLAIQHDHSRAGSEHGLPRPDELDQGFFEPLSLHSHADRCRFAARDDQRVESVQIVDGPHLAGGDVQAREGLCVCLEAPLERENSDERHYQPRCWSSPPFS